MANEVEVTTQHKVLMLDRKEAVNLIGLLTAQLGSVALQGNTNGAVPEIYVTEKG